MKMPHLTNGQKAAAVTGMGAASLVGVIGLAIADLAMGRGAGQQSALMPAAFAFLCANVTASMSYLMGASAPDPGPMAQLPLSPGETRLAVTSEARPPVPVTTDDDPQVTRG